MSLLDVRILKNGSLKKPVMVVVGRGTAKRAVQRNLLKKRIKAILQPVFKECGNNYLIRVRPETAQASFTELRKVIWEKLKISSK